MLTFTREVSSWDRWESAQDPQLDNVDTLDFEALGPRLSVSNELL